LRVSLWNQWLDPKVYLKPPGFTRRKSRLIKQFQQLTVYGRALS